MSDPFHLQRFVDAQADSFQQALSELTRGRKTSHWMWFVFPQIAGLGSSPMARRFAIASVAEAQAFVRHPLLGDRLIASTAAACAHADKPPQAIFGQPDDMKFRSSMTLFSQAAPGEAIFAEALRLFFAGEPDPLTLERIRSTG